MLISRVRHALTGSLSALARPRAFGAIILFLLVIASALVGGSAGPALWYGLTVERRTAPDRPGPISVEPAVTTDVLTRVLQQAAGAQWVIWRGAFEVPPAGVKGFRLTAKGGAQLFVDGLLALQATGGDAVARQVSLDGGSHELVLIYQHLEGAPAIELEWINAEQRREIMPGASLAPQSMPRAAWYLRKRPKTVGIAMATAWVVVGAYLLGVFLGPFVLRFLELEGSSGAPGPIGPCLRSSAVRVSDLVGTVHRRLLGDGRNHRRDGAVRDVGRVRVRVVRNTRRSITTSSISSCCRSLPPIIWRSCRFSTRQPMRSKAASSGH